MVARYLALTPTVWKFEMHVRLFPFLALVAAACGSDPVTLGTESPNNADSEPGNNSAFANNAGTPEVVDDDIEWLDVEVVIREGGESYFTAVRSRETGPAPSANQEIGCVAIDSVSDTGGSPFPESEEYGEITYQHGETTVESSGPLTELFETWTMSLAANQNFEAAQATADTPPESTVMLEVVDTSIIATNTGEAPILLEVFYSDGVHGWVESCPDLLPGSSFTTAYGNHTNLKAFTYSRVDLGFAEDYGTFWVLRELGETTNGIEYMGL